MKVQKYSRTGINSSTELLHQRIRSDRELKTFSEKTHMIILYYENEWWQ